MAALLPVLISTMQPYIYKNKCEAEELTDIR